jgi:hypothetical protein
VSSADGVGLSSAFGDGSAFGAVACATSLVASAAVAVTLVSSIKIYLYLSAFNLYCAILFAPFVAFGEAVLSALFCDAFY